MNQQLVAELPERAGLDDDPGAFVSSLVVVGLSYRSAPVSVRERLAIAADERAGILERLCDMDSVREAMVISTCNRVELYLSGPTAASVSLSAREALRRRAPSEDVESHLYEHRGREALLHLFRVTSALDSLVLGEPQILGQVKEAFEAARLLARIGGVLGRAMHRSFHVAKRVRSETALGEGQVSVASVAVDLARTIYSNLAGREVLLLGAGEIAESAARALRAAGATRILIANRSFERAEALCADIEGAAPRSLTELPTLLEHADIVLVSTGASGHVVTAEVAAAAVRRRRGRPLFFVDVAVPRNVDPRVHDLDNCYRYDIDDLEHIVADGMKDRALEAQAAERIVREELEAYVVWAKQSQVTPTIVALRERVQSTFAAELERSFKGRLRHLGDDDRRALTMMVDSAINKLLHTPTRVLKESIEKPEGELLVEAVRTLFRLEPANAPALDEAEPSLGGPLCGRSR